MTNKEVFKILNEDLFIAQEKFEPNSIIAIYAYGKINDEEYDDEVTIEDIETEVIFIPTFEDFCIDDKPKVHYLNSPHGNLIKCIDVRILPRATKRGHTECIEVLFTGFYIVNPRYQHIFETQLLCNKEKIKACIAAEEPAQELITALIKMMRYHFNDTSATVKFIKQLTDAEKIALKGIVQKYGDENTIKQGNLASELGLSRLTFTKLIGKMRENHIAKIEYLGPEGTYYKILDDTLLNITGDDL